MALLVLVVLLVNGGSGASAKHSQWQAVWSGNEVYEGCTQRSDPDADAVEEMMCLGFIIGVADSGAHRACLTGGLEPSQIKDAVVAWLRENPAVRHEAAARLVARALEETYPCQ